MNTPLASVTSDTPPPLRTLAAHLPHRHLDHLVPLTPFLDRLAMEGGPDRALAWLGSHPRILSADHVHLTRLGAEKVGSDMADVLLARLGRDL